MKPRRTNRRTRRRAIILGALAGISMLVAGGALGQAGSAARHRIAWVHYGLKGQQFDWFRQQLLDLGFAEERNLTIQTWSLMEGPRPDLIVEQVIAWKPEVIAVSGIATAQKFRLATSRIPIVFQSGVDPVARGLVPDLAHPGGNVTGVYTSLTQLNMKKIEIAREIVPRARRIGLLFHRASAYWDDNLEGVLADTRGIADLLKFQVVEADIAPPFELRAALEDLARQKAEIVLPFFLWYPAGEIADFQRRYRIPVIGQHFEPDADGPVMGIGADYREVFSRQAALVARVLAGARPGDLPVDAVTRFQIGVNLKVAREIKLEIPQSILARAERVVR
jgi:ABC-type uncharacterized transport system substrate-binding protein